MRFLLLLLLLPQLVNAQFNSFTEGAYALVSSRTIRHQASLKLRDPKLLLVKDASGKTTKFTPDDVEWFLLKGKKYVTAEEFDVPYGGAIKTVRTVDKAFVAQVDSGKVILMHYDFYQSIPGSMGANGGGGGWNESTYLLRPAQAYTVTNVPVNWLTGGGKKFRETLLPFLADRPDLIKLVTDKLISDSDLPDLIHALNSGQPFTRTPHSTQ